METYCLAALQTSLLGKLLFLLSCHLPIWGDLHLQSLPALHLQGQFSNQGQPLQRLPLWCRRGPLHRTGTQAGPQSYQPGEVSQLVHKWTRGLGPPTTGVENTVMEGMPSSHEAWCSPSCPALPRAQQLLVLFLKLLSQGLHCSKPLLMYLHLGLEWARKNKPFF